MALSRTVNQPADMVLRMDSGEPEEVQRWDAATLGAVTKTPQGGIRVDAHVSRSSAILIYQTPKGPVREYCPPEELFREDSLATLAGAPVTDRHPPGLVTTRDFSVYARGHVSDSSIRRDGDKVAASLVIQDAGLIGAIERKDRREVSAGYVCRVENTPGQTPTGERYDRIQRDRRYNHVAIVERGRAGSDVALRLDSQGNQDYGANPREEKSMETIRIDGVDYPLGTEAERKAAAQAHARYQTRVDAELAAARKAVDQATARADAAEATAKEVQTKLDAATDPAVLDARVEARAGLVSKARAILGAEAKLDGKDVDVMRACITKVRPETKLDGKSEDYVRAAFDMLPVERADVDGLGKLRVAANPLPIRKDTEDKTKPPSAREARERMDATNRAAWQQPLAVSKDKVPAGN